LGTQQVSLKRIAITSPASSYPDAGFYFQLHQPRSWGRPADIFPRRRRWAVSLLIFWALIITISIKYCLFVMRADNHGEGGILALMSMTGANWSEGQRILIVMGLFGAALIYGDGIITPAISVFSALEGLNVATDVFKPHVVLIAVAILLGLFAIQRRGTAQIAKALGPVMLLWFAVIAALGVAVISRYPAVIAAADPRYGIALLTGHAWSGIAVLGGVFLAMTGAEAMYADLGHIGRNPIRTSWYGIVLPALLLNYAGQVALFLNDPAMDRNPFFRLAPSWSIYLLVGLATVLDRAYAPWCSNVDVRPP
jgi:KUP system potassium uptake protein